MARLGESEVVWDSLGVISTRYGEIMMKWGRLGVIWRKVLAFGHLEIV